MKKYIVEMRRGLKWKKTWWTVPRGTHPFPVSIPSVNRTEANAALKRAQDGFPDGEYRIAEAQR